MIMLSTRWGSKCRGSAPAQRHAQAAAAASARGEQGQASAKVHARQEVLLGVAGHGGAAQQAVALCGRLQRALMLRQ